MRKGFASQTAQAAAVHRHAGARRIASNALACLIGLLLVLQLTGLHQHRAGAAPRVTAKAAALASLGAAIGQPATLCEHGDGAPLPDGRDGSSDCGHCIFCHSVAAGFVPAFGLAFSIDRVAIVADIARSREQAVIVRARAYGSATPRGPPALG